MLYLSSCCLQRLFTPEEMERHWSCVMGISIQVFSLHSWPLHWNSLQCSVVEKRLNNEVTNSFITLTHMQTLLPIGAHTNSPSCMCMHVCVRAVSLWPTCDGGGGDDDDDDDDDAAAAAAAGEPSFGLKIVWQELPSLSWSANNLICFYLPLVSPATPTLWSHAASSMVEVDCIACKGTHRHAQTLTYTQN